MLKRTLLLLICLISLSYTQSAMAAGEAAIQPTLSPSDCVKCHTSQPADIEANGAKHKSAINCQNCHAAHRPSSKNNIPLCTQCHQGKVHFNQ
jgi:hypothetical protein